MNPYLDLLQPYPFQRLRELFAGITPNAQQSPIDLSIGEPRHATPERIKQAITQHLDGLAAYPATLGIPALRNAIADWLVQRYGIPALDPATQVMPVNGSREALFAFAQVVINASGPHKPVVISPNPFYQIYEGAALLAGAEPWYLPTLPEHDYRMRFEDVPPEVLQRTQLVYVCSPGNPTGHVMHLDEWQALFTLSDRYGFVIASDECYSEIYPPNQPAPLGALTAAWQLGRHDFARLVVFSSLSKRSNVPGMRSGFVAGNADLLQKFLLYRTYHGSAMSPVVQHASISAWQDEQHVANNRQLYAEKFAALIPLLQPMLPAGQPDAAFYLWLNTGMDDLQFTRQLYAEHHVTVLPGSFLARDFQGNNPGRGFIRVALVASTEACLAGGQRILSLYQQHHS